jgi:hypothetical protein
VTAKTTSGLLEAKRPADESSDAEGSSSDEGEMKIKSSVEGEFPGDTINPTSNSGSVNENNRGVSLTVLITGRAVKLLPVENPGMGGEIERVGGFLCKISPRGAGIECSTSNGRWMTWLVPERKYTKACVLSKITSALALP